MGPLGGIIVLIVTNLVVAEEVSQFTDGGNIVAGAGYSSDKQQIVPQRCYNATVSSTTAQQGVVQLGTAQSFSELENVLGISASASVGFWTFSAEAKASYMRSIQDRDYSMSLNYYQYGTNNVAVQLGGYGEKALTETGREYYNGGKNPYFGVFCGDYYIGSYQQGALLTMGLNIRFSSSSAKNEFMEKAGATFGDIVSAAESVKKVVTENKINGSVTMHAFQMGGEPSQLSNILSNDSSGQYFALACSLTAMDKCVKAASGLLDYAKRRFSNQFSTVNNTGLTPLGTSFTEFIPISYTGLKPPVSLVTPEVEQHRNDLFGKLKENEYYQQKLHPFFDKGYPVELEAGFLKNASFVLTKANRNVDILMQAHGGAADCFNFPDKCKSVKAGIFSQLQNVTEDDLRFLEAVKYAITTRGGMVYNTGVGSDSTAWLAVPDKKPKNEKIVFVSDLSVTDKIYHYRSNVRDPIFRFDWKYDYTGKITNDSMTYIGDLYYRFDNAHDPQKVLKNHTEEKVVSPFFFEVYSISK